MKKRNNRLSSGTGAMLAALACLFLLLLLCAACTQEGGVPGTAGGNPPAGGEDDPQAGTELVVGSVSIGTAATDAAAGQTRAVTPVALTSGSIGIGVRAENGYAAQQVKYTYNSTTGKWEPDGTPGIQLMSGAASLYAWYPYEATNGIEPIPLLLQTYSDAKNLHFCNSGGDNVCATYPGATFELKPIYTRLQVNITGADPSVAASPLIYIFPTNPNDKMSGFVTEGNLSLTGDVTTTNGDRMQLFHKNYHVFWDAQTLKIDILMIPNDSNPIERMEIILVKSSALIWELSFSDAPIALEAGKTYTVNVQLDKGTISIKETINKEDYELPPTIVRVYPI